MKLEDAWITYTPEQEGDDTEEEEDEEDDDTEEVEEEGEQWKLQRKGRILGSNPIPRSMGKFSFTITCSTPNQDFAVGFTSEHKSLVYEGGVGVISKEEFRRDWNFDHENFWKVCYHKRQISSVYKTNINDPIECCLVYQTFRERRYAIVQIMKNSQLISSQALEIDDVVWPVITIGSSQTKIDTNTSSQGNETPDISGILIKIE